MLVARGQRSKANRELELGREALVLDPLTCKELYSLLVVQGRA